jgi:hypothetical protein
MLFLTGVNGSVTIAEGGDARGALLRRGVDRLEKDFKSEFFILFNHFRETRFISREPFFPTLLFEFLFSTHLINLVHPHPDPLPSRERGKRFLFFQFFFSGHFSKCFKSP